MWEKTSRYLIAYQCPEFTIATDEFLNGGEQMVFMHVTVTKWSAKTMRELLRVFAAFRSCTKCPLYAVRDLDNAKDVKFISRFGFKPLIEIICVNGERRHLFVNLKEEKDG